MSLDRNYGIFHMRQAGGTYREIGEKVGLTVERIRQIVLWVERHKNRRESKKTEYQLALITGHLNRLLSHRDCLRFLKNYDEFMDAFAAFEESNRAL